MPKKAKYRVRNWTKYNKALVARGSLFVWVSKKMIKKFVKQPDESAHGNQRYPNAMIECCLTIRQLYGLSLRATQGFMESLFKLMKIDFSPPDYSTLSRRAKHVKIILRSRPLSEGIHLLVDSTGVQVIGGSEWKTIRHKKKRKQLWRKLHIGVDADSLDIGAALMTESQRLDGNYLEPLVEQIDVSIRQMTGDGAYDKRSCYRLANERSSKPVFPPQHNAIVQRNKFKKDLALKERDELINYLNRGKSYKNRLTRWKNKNDYHRRSLVETTMFRLKTLFGDKVNSKNFDNQATDLMIRCAIINKMNLLGMPDSVKVA